MVKLALANYRAQSLNLPDSEHADNALLLLRLANEDETVVQWATALTGADSAELQKSAIYYIEHQCFNITSDFYGILALTPWATLDDLKTHYRLLIRIFHPDRGFVSELRAEKYSAMINQAYAALKNSMPVQAKITDASAKPKKGISKFVQEELKAARNKRAWFRLIDLNQIRWFTPGKILLGFALVAASSIYYFVMPETAGTSTFEVMRGANQRGLGYYDDEPISVTSGNVRSEIENTAIKLSQLESRNVDKVFIESARPTAALVDKPVKQEQTSTDEAQPQHDVVMAPPVKEVPPVKEAPGAQVPEVKVNESRLKLNETRRMSAASVKTATDTQKAAAEIFKPLKTPAAPSPTASDVKAAAKPQSAASSTAIATRKPASNEQMAVVTQTATPDKVLAVTEPASNQLNSQSNNHQVSNQQVNNQKVAVVEKPAELAADPMPTAEELRKLVFLFVDGYQRGDIQTFMQAFADDVQSDEGPGRDNLQQAYIDVFNTTSDREMVVKNLHWVQQGQQMQGNATYEVKIRRNERTKSRMITGKLRFDVKKLNNQSKIKGFYYVAEP